MLFKFHYALLTSGWCASTSLLGVFVGTYTNVSSLEIGSLFTIMPFCSIITRPLISSKADREAAHKKYLILCMIISAISYFPFILIPHLGPEVYEGYPRLCWHSIVVLKVMGDIALTGAISVGDALAINYTRRIGAEFTSYRVWGTISWMLFGIIIGQINEVSFLPKYTPAFMIMVTSLLLDALIIWLWPDEYFRMVPLDQIKKLQEQRKANGSTDDEPRSLLTGSQVLAHMRAKLFGGHLEETTGNKPIEVPVALPIDNLKSTNDNTDHGEQDACGRVVIDKRTQFRILWLLFMRDPRVWLYIGFLILIGMLLSTLGFYMMALGQVCNQESGCDFSHLAGLLQVSMAAAETVMFFYIKPLKKMIGRVSFCIAGTLMAGIENLIYVYFWNTMNPYHTLLLNIGRGITFGVSVLLMTDVAYLFANEVGYLLPELKSRGLIKDSSPEYAEQLKLSLVATMQALTGAAADGIGRGFGSLSMGLVIDKFSYQGLWICLCYMSWIGFLASSLVQIFDLLFKPNLGLDVKAALSERQATKHKEQHAACV